MKHLSKVYKIKIEPGTKCLYCDNVSRHLALCQRHYNRWYQGTPMEDPKKNITIDREKLAWAAGFYDGEGTMCCKTINGKWSSLSISIHQTNKDTLERFQDAVSGLGKVTGPEKSASRLHPNRLPIYLWRCQKFEDAQQVVCLLSPWLTPHKKKQAYEALRNYQQRGNHRSLNQ